MSAGAALELASVTKRYGAVTAVNAIDLKIAPGTYCCLLGPSGCGKTSTLRMIAGHETVSQGDILLGARNVTDLAPAERNTAMMFQSYALFPHLSVIDNVAFALKMRGIDKATRHREAASLLDLVDMGSYAQRLPAQLSGGQQQRVALARALITKPQILLLQRVHKGAKHVQQHALAALLDDAQHLLVDQRCENDGATPFHLGRVVDLTDRLVRLVHRVGER